MWSQAVNKSSRKLQLGMYSLLLIFASGLLAALNPIFLTIIPVMVSGFVGIFAIYCGGNVANKHVVGKILSQNPMLNGHSLEHPVLPEEGKDDLER